MKLQFKHQPYQSTAVSAIVDLFRGQEKRSTTFSIVQESQISLLQNDYGVGNGLFLSDTDILSNMGDIQRRSNLPVTDDLQGMQFSVEMETGTGKTYVYTKTIFELNKQYGFTKFIIVVPSVAIREGVYKSFEITKEHFALQYDNVPYRYFIYNSQKLSSVRDFAMNADIEIMIINIDAFKKSENIINQAQDKLNGETAMRYIQDTNPIVIIDEPQSVDNTDKAKEAIASLNPLCVLRYSATHREKINLMYRLTPVDAYQMGLVKQICVSSNQVANDFNKPYIRLVSVSFENGYSAKIEIDKVNKQGKAERKIVTVKPNADLYIVSGERDMYEKYTIEGIECFPGRESIEFTNGEVLRLGHSMGDIDEYTIKKAQIKRTVETHLEKELRYYNKGIKVLSLFFIDEVKKYRELDGTNGIYARMFEESYAELMALPKYAVLREHFPTSVSSAHNGYFSQDKKGTYKDTKGDTLADDNTYNTIMKDKEWLLSFDCPLRFIWSHSALKEGWDNPNVFQVCTLIEQKSTFTCRQKVGRGLRLCVNQSGERIEDKDINVLHVMANESFAEFADTLQKEIESETGMRFGVLEIGMFTNLTYTETVTEQKQVTLDEAVEIVNIVEHNQPIPLKYQAIIDAIPAPTVESVTGLTYTESVTVERQVTHDDATELLTHFEDKGYITKSGKIKDTMKAALQGGTLDLPKKFEAARDKFEKLISKADTKPPIRDASKDVIVRLNKQVLLSPEFMELWNKIKQKTTYRVRIDTAEFIKRCSGEIASMPEIPRARILTKTANINIKRAGITHTETSIRATDVHSEPNKIPDILLVLQTECDIPLRVCRDIIIGSGRLQDFANNPQLFIENAIDVINRVKHTQEIDGIRYMRLDDEEYYVQEIFDSEELMANLDRNAVAVKHSAYDYVIYDSETVERPFAMALDNDPDVRMFFKIPSRFKIQTPIGTYNPDWAVYMDKDGAEKLYFVLETKGSLRLDDLRTPEQQKIHCGERHFAALEDDIELKVAKEWDRFKVGQ